MRQKNRHPGHGEAEIRGPSITESGAPRDSGSSPCFARNDGMRQVFPGRGLVPEVALAGEDHGKARFVGGLDHVVVAD